MRFNFPKSIKNDFEGYNFLIDFYDKTKNLVVEEIILDFGNTAWLEANLIAILGAILNKAQSELNNIRIENLSIQIKDVLSKNHFLSHFGGLQITDYHDTTTKYKKFKIIEEKLFKDYLDRELLSKKAMPNMSVLLRKKINGSILEIFNNAVLHGDCQNVFTCGQYYPHKKKLDFTIVDLGNTIKNNVNNYLKNNSSGNDAIKWAVTEGNTTKQGPIPGGLGLSLIREFLNKNRGKIQIISADGYWEQKADTENSNVFSLPFPGTIVNLEFNIGDESYYCLSSEINEKEIF